MGVHRVVTPFTWLCVPVRIDGGDAVHSLGVMVRETPRTGKVVVVGRMGLELQGVGCGYDEAPSRRWRRGLLGWGAGLRNAHC